MENYLVLYRPGLGGSWLGWFINTHKNFAQYPLYEKTKGLGKTIDIGCDGIDWIIDQSDEYTTEQSYESFEENRIKAHKTRTVNHTHTKDSVKVLNIHDLSLRNPDGTAYVDNAALVKVTSEIKPRKIIIPILKDHLMDAFSSRWTTLMTCNNSPEIINDKVKWTQWVDYLMKENPYHNQPYAEVYYCDIGKLISDGGEEYTLLCEAIGEKPNDDAREQLDWYKDIILQFL